MATTVNEASLVDNYGKPPPDGSPYGVALPGSQRPNRSAIYRHHKFVDGPLLPSFDPAVQSVHDLFEISVARRPNKKCFGVRNWLPATKTWDDKFDWITFAEVRDRRKNLGAGLVEIHKRLNYNKDKYGVGIWAQNRPEWQIVGMFGFP